MGIIIYILGKTISRIFGDGRCISEARLCCLLIYANTDTLFFIQRQFTYTSVQRLIINHGNLCGWFFSANKSYSRIYLWERSGYYGSEQCNYLMIFLAHRIIHSHSHHPLSLAIAGYHSPNTSNQQFPHLHKQYFWLGSGRLRRSWSSRPASRWFAIGPTAKLTEHLRIPTKTHYRKHPGMRNLVPIDFYDLLDRLI